MKLRKRYKKVISKVQCKILNKRISEMKYSYDDEIFL